MLLQLSDFEDIAQFRVLRDGSFATLGLITIPQPAMLVFLEEERFLKRVRALDGLGAVITTPALAKRLDGPYALAQSSDSRRSFFDLHNHLALETEFYWRSHPSEIHPTAEIHPRAWINPTDVRIGRHCRIDANAIVHARVELGRDVIVHSGAVLGTAGLQRMVVDGTVGDLAHAGGVRIEDNVQVLCNAVIAAAVFRQSTTIGAGTRIGNLAYLSHNVQVKERCQIGHGAVISGNSFLGNDVTIGPGSTLTDGIHVGAGAHVTAGATVVRDVESGQRVSSGFAVEHRRYLRFLSTMR